MSIFEKATRAKLRFPSARGLLSVEDLWDLPLTSNNGFDLDNVAKTTNGLLKAAAEESFVSTTSNPERTFLELQMEVIKHIIDVRLKEAEAKRNRAARVEERRRLIALLEEKNNEAMRGLSAEDLMRKIAEIDNADAVAA